MSGQKTDARTRGYVRWACFFLLLSLVMAFFFGLLPVSPLAVATGSMEPSVSVGDAVVVCRTDSDRLQVGDVIAYRLDGQTVVHRIVQMQQTGEGTVLQTQGDANNAPNTAPVQAAQVVGRVAAVIPCARRRAISPRADWTAPCASTSRRSTPTRRTALLPRA